MSTRSTNRPSKTSYTLKTLNLLKKIGCQNYLRKSMMTMIGKKKSETIVKTGIECESEV
jgi:hypothetical protein